jgi:hypothetical protein
MGNFAGGIYPTINWRVKFPGFGGNLAVVDQNPPNHLPQKNAPKFFNLCTTLSEIMRINFCCNQASC